MLRARLTALISYWFLPLQLGAGMAGYFYLLDQGHAVGVAALICEFWMVAAVFVVEKLCPAREDWRVSQGDVVADAMHSALVIPLMLAVLPLVAAGSAWLAALFAIEGIWPTTWPMLLQLLLAMCLADGVVYAVHRAQHRVPLLWRYHAVHHSARRLYWLNTYRFHALDLGLKVVPSFGLLLLLGVPAEVFGLFSVMTLTIAFNQHANIVFRAGPLGWLIITPELHRWHHAASRAEDSCNYGQTVSLWDALCGTRYVADDGALPEAVGLEPGTRFPSRFVEHYGFEQRPPLKAEA